jgi:cob(I)alamin adenosyltransferase
VTRIYTRSGDEGTTGLVGGQRVAKDSPVIEAGGSLDELNAAIGVVRSRGLGNDVDAMLQRIQNDLFTIGGEIAIAEGSGRSGQGIGDAQIRHLESQIDALESQLEPLKQFVLPGGSGAAAELHWVRAVARRAERRCVALSRSGGASPYVLRYLNRLSDFCFVLARYVNRQQQARELHPIPRKI